MNRGPLAALLVLAAVVTACSTEAELKEEGWAGAAAGPTPAEATQDPAYDGLFSCERTFTRATVAPDDLVEQGGISEWTGGFKGDGFEVKRAASSPLGLVALVVGDEERARAELVPRGVALVGAWDESESTRSTTPFAQVRALVEAQLVPVAAEVEAAVAGLDGVYDVRAWEPNGEVVVQWQEPVPAEVRALAGERPGRIRVVVEAVPYSQAEVDAAVAAVATADVGVEVTDAYGCADGSGVVVGVAPDDLGDQRAALQDRLAEVVGVPVLVIAQEVGARAVG